MSLLRKLQRHENDKQGIRTRRGVRHQTCRHIIKKGVRQFRTIARGNQRINVPGLCAMELHATKGWRYVPAWS